MWRRNTATPAPRPSHAVVSRRPAYGGAERPLAGPVVPPRVSRQVAAGGPLPSAQRTSAFMFPIRGPLLNEMPNIASFVVHEGCVIDKQW